MEPIIEIKNVGKSYRLGSSERYLALRDTLTNILRSPFSWGKTKTQSSSTNTFWALKDINLTIKQGEIIGIIGRNGAGKSTLLKILSRITPPTTGEIRIHGRIGSLLEVGTGFHPELSGRENIFLNGAILGMRKNEIEKKFDEIVAFAEIGEFLDTPVKRYSSGMYVRLAFAVAAHLEPEILIVDEVLAVGDSEFQKKCLGKINSISKTAGRTVIFVSHNMGVVQNLCQKTILLEKGQVTMYDDTAKVIDYYLNKGGGSAVTEFTPDPSKDAQITKVVVRKQDGKPQSKIPLDEKFFVDIYYSVYKNLTKSMVSMTVFDRDDILLMASESDAELKTNDYTVGEYVTTVTVPQYLFNTGSWFFDVNIHKPMIISFDHRRGLHFEITDVNNPRSNMFAGNSPGKIANILEFSTKKY
jgi:lipopolysaccharide transport system ATP-binding protein